MKRLMILFIFILFLGGISALCEEGQIDINSASKEKLTEIIYIGEVRAEELISLRPFASVDELIKIKGIGEVYLDKIKEQGLACVDGEINEPIEETEEINEEPLDEIEEEIIEQEEQETFYEEPLNFYQTPIELQIIKLGELNSDSDSKDIKSEDNKEDLNKTDYAKYCFISFCVLLGFLFILKKGKSHKNEFE